MKITDSPWANEANFSNYNSAYDKQGPTWASRLLFHWLSDDKLRNDLYNDINSRPADHPTTLIKFESRAYVDVYDEDVDCCNDDRPKEYRQDAYLVIHRDHVERAYSETTKTGEESLAWSHSPYDDLGGTFMLALDEPIPGSNHATRPFLSHDEQRTYCYDFLKQLQPWFDPLATVAFKSGGLLPLKQRNFDLADVAELIAAHYAAVLFGFSQADVPLLKETAKSVGRGLMYVNAGRHFFADPFAVPHAKQALGMLTQRAAQLIDLYQGAIGTHQQDELEDLEEEWQKLRNYQFDVYVAAKGHGQVTASDRKLLKEFKPMMQLMAAQKSKFSTTEQAILVAGLISGTITNMRAAVCISIRQFFQLNEKQLIEVRDKARDARLESIDANWFAPKSIIFRALVEEALRVNPPPPFVPRRAGKSLSLASTQLPENSQIVIAVGGGSWVKGGFDPSTRGSGYIPKQSQCPFSKVFGGAPELTTDTGRAQYLHSCFGKDMAMYSIAHTVRQLMCLPGLTQAIDKNTGEPVGLQKSAGFICDRYPLEYDREKVLRQSALQTVLPVKNPVPEHAAAIKSVLSYGAPFIEKVLREARHVHFASFILMDNDSKLVLFTAYDGDFDGYIGHFAREFGPLFDRFFSHIEGGPPAPIAEHAFEFVQFLKRYQYPSVGGLLFSAYPETRVDDIAHTFNKNRDFDFFTLEGKS